MCKNEFIKAVAEKSGFSNKEVDTILGSIIDVIMESVKNGEKVQFVGFGTFEARERAAKKGINPKTKKKIKIPAKTVPVFKAGKKFKDAVSSK